MHCNIWTKFGNSDHSASLKKKTHLDGPTNENVLTILENRSLLLENARIKLWLEFPNSFQKL